MEDKTNIPLTAAEIAGLWTHYMGDSIAVCVYSYFLEKVEDEEIRPIIEWTLDTAKENISIMQELFHKENFPIPLGFTEKDVNTKAPRLFTDTFFLRHLSQMAVFAITASSAALTVATRPDVIHFQKRILNKGVELQDRTRDLMLEQGIYIKPPSIPIPEKVDFVEKQHYLGGFFWKKRSINSHEITHLYLNTLINSIGKEVVTGFAQIAQNEDVKQYLLRGKELAHKYVDLFSNSLTKEDLPAPISSDSAVLDTTEYIFSDKLMMFHVTSMVATGIGYYGTALAASSRRDLGLKYMSLIPEAALYVEDGANIMIKHGWMEEPPQAIDRDKLIQN
ncbi:DUF3231 family protein [Siminovitchia acidinfaciens]|uniref:DUF3231 family protein n=1 Tax=Siminovitchia acidinfaciens TaxID=2321395 RepID=A0A429XTK0_9BACI|nr:DUF3231 family protein [Siminovitchia acidinfaciens]RST71107.1 DUF3231 family protein [Siminovitchia acidinfaciens]